MEGGTLYVTIYEGKLYRNTELFGEMDPFVEVISKKGVKIKTKVIDEGGKHPVWNQTLEVPIDSIDENVEVRCYDEDVMMDDFVGSTSFPVRDMLGKKQWYVLHYEGKNAAEILIETKFT